QPSWLLRPVSCWIYYLVTRPLTGALFATAFLLFLPNLIALPVFFVLAGIVVSFLDHYRANRERSGPSTARSRWRLALRYMTMGWLAAVLILLVAVVDFVVHPGGGWVGPYVLVSVLFPLWYLPIFNSFLAI